MGRQPLAYRDLAPLNNGSSDARASGRATETRTAQKSLSSVRLYLRSLNIYPMGKTHNFPFLFVPEQGAKEEASPTFRTGQVQRGHVSFCTRFRKLDTLFLTITQLSVSDSSTCSPPQPRTGVGLSLSSSTCQRYSHTRSVSRRREAN